jgi:hypothetical protein
MARAEDLTQPESSGRGQIDVNDPVADIAPFSKLTEQETREIIRQWLYGLLDVHRDFVRGEKR